MIPYLVHLHLSSLPPVIYHMSLYAKRAAPRFKPYQLGGNVPTALELRFMPKSLPKHDGVDISLIDEQQGKDIFERGVMRMSDATVRAAAIAKRADAESKRLRAMSTAWEIEATERHAILLQTILRDDAEQYLESLAEASFFERLLVERSGQQLEDDAEFTTAAHTHDLTAHPIADEQLNQQEEINSERELHLPLDDADAEVRLDECMDIIPKESETAT